MKASEKAAFVFLVLITFFLTSCQSKVSPAVQSMQKYLQALVNKNEDEMMSLICPSYEMDALLELDSYGLFRTQLRGVSCREVGSADNEVKVVCKGEIEAAYTGGTQSFDLSMRTYTIINEEGNWLVCGYAH